MSWSVQNLPGLSMNIILLFAWTDFDYCTGNPCEPGTCRREGAKYVCDCPKTFLAVEGFPPRCAGIHFSVFIHYSEPGVLKLF